MLKPAPPLFSARGTSSNPSNRFESLNLTSEEIDFDEEETSPSLKTIFLKDHSRSAIATNDSPDVGFSASLNPYRGCEHGCIYCYARPTHEYLSFSSGLDFESKILVKENAPELLRKELSSKNWKPQVIAMSGVTDCYQPVERRLKLTRRCLEVLADFRNPVFIITKNFLVTRDIDVLSELARHQSVAVLISITTLDLELKTKMEPRTSSSEKRLLAIETLAKAQIPVGVNVAPVIPALNDHEISKILKRAAEAGAKFAGMTLVRLPYGVKNLFETWLETHYPDRKQKILHRIESMRGGKLNDPRFGSRMRGDGVFADQIREVFHKTKNRMGFGEWPALNADNFRKVTSQLTLF